MSHKTDGEIVKEMVYASREEQHPTALAYAICNKFGILWRWAQQCQMEGQAKRAQETIVQLWGPLSENWVLENEYRSFWVHEPTARARRRLLCIMKQLDGPRYTSWFRLERQRATTFHRVAIRLPWLRLPAFSDPDRFTTIHLTRG